MQIEVNTTFEQYFEGTRMLNLHTTVRRRICFWLIWYVYPVLGIVFALFGGYLWWADREAGGTLLQLAFAGFLLWCRFRYPARVRRGYEQQARNFPGRMTLDARGVDFERSNGTAVAHLEWRGFESWMECPGMFLLFPHPLSFLVIPKDRLTGDEQAEVREWISAEVRAAT